MTRALVLDQQYSIRHPPVHDRTGGNVPNPEDVSIGEWTDLEFETPYEPIEHKSQRNPTRPGYDKLESDTCLATLYNIFAPFYDASQSHLN
jgi:hypothetical protein